MCLPLGIHAAWSATSVGRTVQRKPRAHLIKHNDSSRTGHPTPITALRTPARKWKVDLMVRWIVCASDARFFVISSCNMSLARLLACLCLIAGGLAGEEGMWTFDNLPLQTIGKKYGFTPSAQWLEHVRLSCVRFSDGGSGSFISPEGLVLTNHHVALGQLQKSSSPQHDYVRDGFYARTREEERSRPTCT
jgi:hypothetical protein